MEQASSGYQNMEVTSDGYQTRNCPCWIPKEGTASVGYENKELASAGLKNMELASAG